MKPLKILTLLLLFSITLFCQNLNRIDSLVKKLSTLDEDSLKAKTLYNISYTYRANDPKTALSYGEKALQLAIKLKMNYRIPLFYENISNCYNYMGDPRSSLKYSLKALEKWEELNHKKGISVAASLVAVSYSDIGDNKKAMEYYLRALKLSEDLNDQYNIARNLTNLSSLYIAEKDTTTSLSYSSKALQLAEKKDFKDLIAINLGNLGNTYTGKGEYTKALQFLMKGLEMDTRHQNKHNIAGWLLNIAGVYQAQSDSADIKGNEQIKKEKTETAISYLLKALKLSRELENSYYESHTLGNLASIYINLKKYKEAETYLKQSNDIAVSIGANELVVDNFMRFNLLYKKINNHAKALEYYEKHTKLKDSISNNENKKIIAELGLKYESEKKEAENSRLAQQNKILELSVTNNKYLTIGLITVLILLLSIGFLIIRQHKLKSKKENIRLEQKLLRTQMNPHFIFNSLSGIESFIYEHQPKEAGNYLSQFARLMRLILENSASEYISLDKEIETLNYYLSLQKLRLNDNLQYNVEVNDISNPEQIFLPPMLTQPFIENAIEHGFRGLKECGIIHVSFRLKDNYLEIKIRDNGIGIVQAQQQKDLYKEHKSMAMQITYERLKFLNRTKKQKLIFNIKEINEQDKIKGTEVQFTIPL